MILKDEILSGGGGSGVNPNIIKHWDISGTFIEDIDFSSHLNFYDPGYVVANAWAIGFAQYRTSIYVLVIDFNKYNVVMEYDKSLAFVRTVCRVLDPNDAAQNPDGWASANFEQGAPWDIDVDDEGNIYIGSIGTAQRANVFKYDNSGAFVSRIVTVALTMSSPAWAIQPIIHNIYGQDLKIQETSVADDARTVILQRYDQTGAMVDPSYIDIYTNVDTPGTRYSEPAQEKHGVFDCNKNYYFGSFDEDSLLGPPGAFGAYNNRVHIVAPDLSLTHILLSMPTNTYTPRSVRPISDASHLWVKTFGPNTDFKTYMFQALTSDGSLVIDKIEILSQQDQWLDIFVYRECGARRSFVTLVGAT